eukprot:UN01458
MCKIYAVGLGYGFDELPVDTDNSIPNGCINSDFLEHVIFNNYNNDMPVNAVDTLICECLCDSSLYFGYNVQPSDINSATADYLVVSTWKSTNC